MFTARFPVVALGSLLTLLAPVAAQSVFPTGTTIWEPAATQDGYTIFAAQGGNIVMIDMDGTTVHEWTSPVPGLVIDNVQPLSNGRILCLAYASFAEGRRQAFELNFDSKAMKAWSVTDQPEGTAYHHDIERLPNGNTLFLMKQDIDVPSISPHTLVDDYIEEVDADGNVVWRWDTYQHFDDFAFPADSLQLISDSGGDWAHANSISVIPPNSHGLPEFAEGNIIVSQRFTNTVCIIDRGTGDVVWSLGPEDHMTYGQHWPHMIEQGLPGAGNILIFDNGSGTGYPLRHRAPGRSRVVEIDPVTKTVVWQYEQWFDFWSNIVSGAQRLENGNTLICSGVRGRLFEVTPTGEIVWEYMSPYTNPNNGRRLVYRAYRVPYDFVPPKKTARRSTPEGQTEREL